MEAVIHIRLSDKFYLRDPEDTELGRKIIAASIKLIDELGFEAFTFKKLAEDIHSTEASVYRYFPNKHKLLVYLVSWYWTWLEYRIQRQTGQLTDPKEKLLATIRIISESSTYDPDFAHIREEILFRIVVLEGQKAFFTKHADEDYSDGLFNAYKSICCKVAEYISGTYPQYIYARSLASTVVEAAHHQLFYAEHLCAITDVKAEDHNNSVAAYLEHLVFCALK